MRNHARKTVGVRRFTAHAAPAAVALMLVLGAAPTAMAQTEAPAVSPPPASDDGWDFVANDTTVAAGVTYGGGQGLIVRCENGSLQVAVSGLGVPPPRRSMTFGSTTLLTVQSDQADPQEQTWFHMPGQDIVFSGRPGFSARSLRTARKLTLRTSRTEAGDQRRRFEVDLPADSSAIDRVLTACEEPLSDPRDTIAEAIRTVQANERRPGRTWAIRPDFTALREFQNGYIVASCIYGATGRLGDCRVEITNFPKSAHADLARILNRSAVNSFQPDWAGEIVVMYITMSGL